MTKGFADKNLPEYITTKCTVLTIRTGCRVFFLNLSIQRGISHGNRKMKWVYTFLIIVTICSCSAHKRTVETLPSSHAEDAPLMQATPKKADTEFILWYLARDTTRCCVPSFFPFLQAVKTRISGIFPLDHYTNIQYNNPMVKTTGFDSPAQDYIFHLTMRIKCVYII